jgi:hypothetical protein
LQTGTSRSRVSLLAVLLMPPAQVIAVIIDNFIESAQSEGLLKVSCPVACLNECSTALCYLLLRLGQIVTSTLQQTALYTYPSQGFRLVLFKLFTLHLWWQTLALD